MHPQPAPPPNAHLFLLLPSPPPRQRRCPDPHLRRAPASQTPHSPRVGLLRHGADSRGLRCRLWPGPAAAGGNERAAGSLGPGAEGAAAARRSLGGSHGGRAGRAAGEERPGSEAAPLPGPRGGAGSALGLPHRRRRRRLRCGSKPNMAAAAAALRTRGPRGGQAARGPRAHCALGRGSAALERRRRRPGDMAGGRRRRRRRRLRGALGGEARPLGSHPLRGGEEGAGASFGPARVTCPKHAHVTRASRPSRRALARDVGSLVRGDCCSHSFWRLGRLPPLGAASSPRGAVASGPLPFPFKGLQQPANQEPRCASVGCHSAVSNQSTVCWLGVPQLSVNLSVRSRSAASLGLFFRWFIHSFSKCSTQPTFIAPDSVPGPRGAKKIPHTYLHLINQQIFIGNQPWIN